MFFSSLLALWVFAFGLSFALDFIFIYLFYLCGFFRTGISVIFFSQIFRVILYECHRRCVLLLLSFKFGLFLSLSPSLLFGCVRVWPLCRNFIRILFNTNAECHYVSHSFITLTFLMYIQYIHPYIQNIINTHRHTETHTHTQYSVYQSNLHQNHKQKSFNRMNKMNNVLLMF